MDEDQISDQMLIAAARKRLLAELGGGEGGGMSGGASHITNNLYGGGGVPALQDVGGSGASGPSGLFDSLTGGQQVPAGEDPFDYFVDISRRDMDEINPATGKPIGWEKSVHRWRGSKKKAPMAPMVQEPSYRDSDV